MSVQEWQVQMEAQKAAQAALKPGSVEVGVGVTVGSGSDRYAHTVVQVSPSGKTIYFTQDAAVMKEGHTIYTTQEYDYESTPVIEGVNPIGEPFTNVKSARWSEKWGGYMFYGRVLIAGRNQYYDPSF